MTLAASIQFEHPEFVLDASFTAASGAITALFGASGAGKTTLLRCVAGLEPKARGRVTIGDEVLLDDRQRVAPHRRQIGLVFQHAALFPHRSVRKNLRFAARRAHQPIQDELIARLGISDLLDRSPASLSGGERQRVALARAVLARPRALLLDEPMSALDEAGRAEVRTVIASLPSLIDGPVVLVSHSMTDLVRLADHAVALADGRVAAAGPTSQVVTRYGSELFDQDPGVIVDAQIHDHDRADELTELHTSFGSLWVPLFDALVGRAVRVRIAARDVSLGRGPSGLSSILNEFPVRVIGLEPGGPGQVTVHLQAGDTPILARITKRSLRILELEPGAECIARVKGVSLLA